MAKHHIPDLDAIGRVDNPEVRFFAAVGAVMSLASAIEVRYFDLFLAATKIPRKRAATIFYTIITAGNRRVLVNRVMKLTLNDEGGTLWRKLLHDLGEATGEKGYRNFLGHSPVRRTVTDGPFDGDFFAPECFQTETEDYVAEQDQHQVLSGDRAHRTADYRAALDYARELITLAGRIEAFLTRYELGDFRRN